MKQTKPSYKDTIQKEIIIADCKLYTAALSVLRKEGPTSLVHGIIELRRAWKMYSDLQRKLFNMYKQLEPMAKDVYGVDPNELPEADDEDDKKCPNTDKKSNQVDHKMNDLPLDIVKWLLAAVSYGYGITQLCFSFLPHRFLVILNLLGKQIVFNIQKESQNTADRF